MAQATSRIILLAVLAAENLEEKLSETEMCGSLTPACPLIEVNEIAPAKTLDHAAASVQGLLQKK